MGSVFKPKRKVEVEKNGQTVEKEVRYEYWYIKYKNTSGRWVKEKAYRDKAASEALLKQREQEVERRLAGIDKGEFNPGKPILEALENYKGELLRRGCEAKNTQRRINAIQTCARWCKWEALRDISSPRMTEYLNERSRQGIASTTQDENLLVSRLFVAWCIEMGWIRENPLSAVKRIGKKKAYKRRKRRAFTRQELQALLEHCPERRRIVYLTAALSGYRLNELRRMETDDLNPLGEQPEWKLRAEIDKSRVLHRVPMLKELAAILAPYWQARVKAEVKWSPRLFSHGGKGLVPHWSSFRVDLRRAGIKLQDEQGRWIVFHSLRYTFCQMLALAGVPMPVVQQLMRHSSITLTADLYGELGLNEVGDHVRQLPPLLGGLVPQVVSEENCKTITPDSAST